MRNFSVYRAPKFDASNSKTRTELEDGYYVGTSTDASYPGIVSGPFRKRPKQAAENNILYRITTTGRWVKDPVGFAR